MTASDGYRELTWDAGGGLAAPPFGTVTPNDPATYRGAARRFDLGGVLAEVITASPHHYDRTPGDVAADGPAQVETFVVGEGDVSGTVDSRAFAVHRGDVLVLEDRHPIHYRCDTGFRVLRIVVDSAVIPKRLLQGEPLPAGVIPRTRLVNSTVAFLSALLSGPADGEPEPHLRAVLIDLQVAMIAQARRAQELRDGPGLRQRIETHVREHLGDPSLSPATIAAANGISLRYLHRVFNRGGETIARFVRDERLAAVAQALEHDAQDVSLGELGVRFGFGSRDQLARAFRARYGTTMSAYREEHAAE